MNGAFLTSDAAAARAPLGDETLSSPGGGSLSQRSLSSSGVSSNQPSYPGAVSLPPRTPSETPPPEVRLPERKLSVSGGWNSSEELHFAESPGQMQPPRACAISELPPLCAAAPRAPLDGTSTPSGGASTPSGATDQIPVEICFPVGDRPQLREIQIPPRSAHPVGGFLNLVELGSIAEQFGVTLKTVRSGLEALEVPVVNFMGREVVEVAALALQLVRWTFPGAKDLPLPQVINLLKYLHSRNYTIERQAILQQVRNLRTTWDGVVKAKVRKNSWSAVRLKDRQPRGVTCE